MSQRLNIMWCRYKNLAPDVVCDSRLWAGFAHPFAGSKDGCHGRPRHSPCGQGSGDYPTPRGTDLYWAAQKHDSATHRRRRSDAPFDRGPRRRGAGAKPAGKRLALDTGHRVDTDRNVESSSGGAGCGGKKRGPVLPRKTRSVTVTLLSLALDVNRHIVARQGLTPQTPTNTRRRLLTQIFPLKNIQGNQGSQCDQHTWRCPPRGSSVPAW